MTDRSLYLYDDGHITAHNDGGVLFLISVWYAEYDGDVGRFKRGEKTLIFLLDKHFINSGKYEDRPWRHPRHAKLQRLQSSPRHLWSVSN